MTGWFDWGYWSVFFLMMLENIVPPVPSEAIMGMAGVAVAQGRMAFVPLVLVGTAGTVVGNLFWWEIGRRLGYKRLRPWVDRWGRWLTIEWEHVERFRRYFERWGGATVFVFRFLPFGRTVISIPAGLVHMPLGRFILYTAAGSLIWNTLLVAVGLGLGTWFDEIERWMTIGIIAVGVLGTAVYLWRVFTWKPRAQR